MPSSSFLGAPWHIVISLVEIVLFMPLYLMILLVIGMNRGKETTFQSHYYTLVLSQGIADFATILIFGPVTISRTYEVGNLIIYHLGDYGAARLLVTGAPYLLITRGIGVALITAQRFLTLCRSHSWLEHQIKDLSWASVVGFHWSVSLLIYSPGIVLSEGSFFESDDTLFVVSSDVFNHVSALCVVISFLLCGTLTTTLYVVILKFLLSSRKKISLISKQSRRKYSNEYRLSFHIFLLTIVGNLIFIYWLAELLYGAENKRSTLRKVRRWYPVLSGNYSFINPVVLLILNRDVQRVLRKAVGGKQSGVISVSGQLVPGWSGNAKVTKIVQGYAAH